MGGAAALRPVAPARRPGDHRAPVGKSFRRGAHLRPHRALQALIAPREGPALSAALGEVRRGTGEGAQPAALHARALAGGDWQTVEAAGS
jgi:hypothetical protein